ncbi:hypothetical protein ABFS82_12G068000 [Erythranthe guttata]|uniref:F-box/FBD/LRR-repeat protein At4g26340-like n=1 Tax=Erythranthe guttata TaxID=4155 RepID=UPI00064E0F46|nr:PREDICTED: F-box/FBD/LRR-repeat protein At4g26340-like [Erythranthe guttata]|eukprot:XP_012831230.1 PREDICTED: F-box/FBD/LRR-repeat protein At4g26340-like [Erythranthe guttata]
MKRAKGEEDGSKSMDIISVLPQEILERILYFLPQEDAVRTSVLSKSWRHVWCARPNLAFSVQTFKGKRQDFLITVDKTIQRYRDQRLCVEEFDLCILVDGSDCPSVTFLENWIPLLKHMGMKKFDLSIHSRYSWAFIDMPSVVFGAESLQYLHVAKFVMDQKCIERIVLLKHLDQLHLEQVYIEDAVFQRIISSCPSIETMIIEGCEGLKKINLSDLPNLIYFNFDVVYEDELEEEPCSIEIHAPSSIETINISFGNIWFCKGAEFRNLINLHLRGVDSSLEHMSSCKFPILVWLSLSDCEGLKDIKLFIDAPSMLLFEYQGFFIPSISFGKTTSSWRSELNINYMQINNGYLWFLELNELLNSVSKSRIILSIDQYLMNHDDVIRGNVNTVQYMNGCGIAVVVDRLSLNASLSAGSSNLDGLLRICRPRILMHLDMEVVEWLWKLLMERESGDEGDWFRQLWLRDLEQASLEIRESGREEWRSATLSELRKCRETKSYRTRFALKWRQAS